MLTKEERSALPTRRTNRSAIRAYYLLAAAVISLRTAKADLKAHAQLVPDGWRDLCMLEKRADELLKNMLYTFEPEKRRSVERQSRMMQIRATFGPEAYREPELTVMTTDDLALMVTAAAETCKVRMCEAPECRRCQLGKVLDAHSFVSRNGRVWWEVFSQAYCGGKFEE